MFSDIYDLSTRDSSHHPPTPVHTSQRMFEIALLLGHYEQMEPKRVVEIGSEYGGTLYHWLSRAQTGATVVSIDLYTAAVVPMQPDEVWRSWCPEGVDFHILWGDSQTDEMEGRLKEIIPEIDFLFIDGDHTYQGVKNDFMRYGPMVRPGGIIAFHDLITPKTSPHIGVPKLWREIQAHGYATRELRSMENQPRGGIGVVYV